jgi:hypothetical protein
MSTAQGRNPSTTGPVDQEPLWVRRVRSIRLSPDEMVCLDSLSLDAALLFLVGRELCISRGSGFISNRDLEVILRPRVNYFLAHPDALIGGRAS